MDPRVGLSPKLRLFIGQIILDCGRNRGASVAPVPRRRIHTLGSLMSLASLNRPTCFAPGSVTTHETQVQNSHDTLASPAQG